MLLLALTNLCGQIYSAPSWSCNSVLGFWLHSLLSPGGGGEEKEQLTVIIVGLKIL